MSMRTNDEIGRRALALALFSARVTVEMGLRFEPAKRVEWLTKMRGIERWAEAEDIPEYSTEFERHLLQRPTGDWSPRECDKGNWRMEAMASLLWAAGLLPEFPPEFERVNGDVVSNILPLKRSASIFLNAVNPRPEAEILAMISHIERFGTRALMEMDRRSGRSVALPNPDSITYLGKPFPQLENRQLGHAAHTARERVRALDWVTGRSPQWEDPAQGIVTFSAAQPSEAPLAAPGKAPPRRSSLFDFEDDDELFGTHVG